MKLANLIRMIVGGLKNGVYCTFHVFRFDKEKYDQPVDLGIPGTFSDKNGETW